MDARALSKFAAICPLMILDPIARFAELPKPATWSVVVLTV